MPHHISGPRIDVDGLEDLAPLWMELHRHHRTVSEYRALVQDVAASWQRRLAWYRRLLEGGASYLTASDDEGRLIGYAMVAIEAGPDDTFETEQGTGEIVTLVVTEARRSTGVGQALLGAAEGIARDRGCDTMKIAVMAGNGRAGAFYETHGYSVAEHVLYRRLSDPAA
ncbi:MAG: GNAT family N-acetyltransferase [Solirubrobacterales bacterium]|nr:GNAT family N-acetyltransferase [Solirubrobacterales bacterium]